VVGIRRGGCATAFRIMKVLVPWAIRRGNKVNL
jgi:hypothetical protein